MGVIAISKEKIIERRLSKRIAQKLHLTIRTHGNSLEIKNAVIENISIGGMQFSIPADHLKLQIHDTCSFIFDLPHLGKCYVLGEIRYRLDFSDPGQQTVSHYGVKFIKLSLKIWSHIKQCCQSAANLPGKYIIKDSEAAPKEYLSDETLTSKTFELIHVQAKPENGPELTGIVKDINYGGIKLQFSEPIPLDTSLNIRISFLEHTVTVNGSCNWCDYLGDKNTYLVNISFTDIQHEQFDNLQALMMKLAAHMADIIHKSL